MVYPDYKTWLFFLADRSLYREPLLSRDEVFFSPDCKTMSTFDKCNVVQTPVGTYDISRIFKFFKPDDHPQFLFVKADSSLRNIPVNLSNLNSKNILICGNMQHGVTPVKKMVDYALKENFECIIADHMCRHLHYFREAGFQKVLWLPALNSNPYNIPPSNEYKRIISFVGGMGSLHLYRRYVLKFLQDSRVPIQIMQAPQEVASQVYNQSLISLNISMNGEANLRVFEVLASGGFLLTDRLTSQSGLYRLFKDGEHLVTFKDARDLYDKINYYIKHPEQAKQIARSGYQHYWKNYAPEQYVRRLWHYLETGEIEALYQADYDLRCLYK